MGRTRTATATTFELLEGEPATAWTPASAPTVAVDLGDAGLNARARAALRAAHQRTDADADAAPVADVAVVLGGPTPDQRAAEVESARRRHPGAALVMLVPPDARGLPRTLDAGVRGLV